MKQVKISIFVTLLFIYQPQNVISSKLTFFLGDKTFWEHLRDVCGLNKQNGYKKNIRFFVNNIIYTRNQQTILEYEFSKLGCWPMQIYQNSNNFNITELKSAVHKFDQKTEIILNFYENKKLNENYYKQTMKNISKFYLSCERCKKLIILFDFDKETIIRWTKDIPWIDRIPQQLSAVIVTNLYQKDKAVWIRPLLDGCSMDETIFLPKNEYDFKRLLTHPRDCDLHSKYINVSVNYGMPFCLFNRTKESNEVIPNPSMDFEIMKVLEERYNFNSRYLELSHDWEDNENGLWSGIVGDLIDGSVNMAICGVSVDSDDTAVIDYGTYIFIDQIIIMSQNLALKKNSHLFEHIPMEVLSVSGLVFIITAFSLLVITKMLYYLEVVPHVRSIAFYMTKMFAIAMKQSIYPIVRIKHDSILIVFCFWMLGFLVLSQLYSWIFYSTITAPDYQKPLDTIADFIDKLKESKINVYVRESSILHQRIVESKEESGIYYLISEHFNQSSYKSIQNSNETIEILENDPDGVVLDYRTFAISNRYLQATKIIHISTETLSPTMLGVVYTKHSPLKESFDLLFKNVREFGLLSHWLSSTLQQFTPRDKLYSKNILNNLNPADFLEPIDLTVIYFDETWSLFQIWGIGMSLGCGVFLAELGFAKYILPWKLKKNL